MPCCCGALSGRAPLPLPRVPPALCMVKKLVVALCVPVPGLWEVLLAAGEQRDPSEHMAAASACRCTRKGTALSVPGLTPPKSTFFFVSTCHFSIPCLGARAE